VPFTISHAAAALPFRRARLIPSALVVGTFAPDLVYFVRLQSGGGWGHTIPGALGMSLPLGLITVWIFHRFVKTPVVYLLPDRVRARLTAELVPFRFGTLRRFLLITLSLLIGIATHLLWDALTHPQYGIVARLRFLWIPVRLPVLGWEPWYEVLQLISTLVGIAAIATWCLLWFLHARPADRISANPLSPRRRLLIACLILTASLLGALLRARIVIGYPTNMDMLYDFVERFVVMFGTMTWWQLAMWGAFGPFPRLYRDARVDTRTPTTAER
jgi:hypothetical protein